MPPRVVGEQSDADQEVAEGRGVFVDLLDVAHEAVAEDDERAFAADAGAKGVAVDVVEGFGMHLLGTARAGDSRRTS